MVQDAPRVILAEKSCCNLTLARLTRDLAFPAWDVLMAGDGSASGDWSIGAGWYCTSVERDSGFKLQTYGGWNRGPVMLAELSAYFQALIAFEAQRGDALRQRLRRPYRVLVLTDNQTIVQQQHVGIAGGRIKNVTSPIWAGISSLLKETGTTLELRFIPRISLMLNWAADQVAGRVREEIQDHEKFLELRPGKIYGCDSWDAINPPR